MWPLGMEPLPPTHLSSGQQALADWCAHIHTCAPHVHMGAFTSIGWACLLVVRGVARSGQVGVPHAHLCTGDTHVHRAHCRVWPPCGTHTPGVQLGTRARSALSSRRRPTGRPVPSGFGCPSPLVPLLFLPGPSHSLCFYSLRASDALVSGVTFAGSF